MPVTRMRMRPWLKQKIDSKTIAGLNWVDKDKTMFSIPWKHAARHGWDLDTDACLFKEWAIHTGKYVEGQNSKDPKTWKANFRCAMNSLPDIEEVKDKSINKGHQAVRVFRMLPSTQKSRDKRRKAKETKSRKRSSRAKMDEEKSDTPMDESMSDDTRSTQENTVDSTVTTEQQDLTSVMLSDVPDWSMSVEIGGSTSLNSLYHRFEVSPEHSPDYDCSDDIIQICQQLEKDSNWLTSDGKGFLYNEACTSPGSQWSESSSVDEQEDIRQYTTLGTDFTIPTDYVWNSFCQRIPPLL